MTLKFGRRIFGRGVALPWESIDSADDTSEENSQPPEEENWFLESPSGAWEMETSSPAKTGEEDDMTVPAENLPEEVEIEEEDEAYSPSVATESGAWTISVLCMGLGLIAACLIIPQADANRRLVYEREQLRLELAQVQKQTAVNQEFLAKMESDPQLTERLAQREMRAVEQGEAIINVQNTSAPAGNMSPFTLVNVPPPAALTPYEPVGGVFAQLCRNPQSHIYILGMGMFFVAGGLVLGGPAKVKNLV